MTLLKFSGNPLIDNGNSVIAMMCKKEHFHEVSKMNILNHIDDFLEVIKVHFNDERATKKEKEFAKCGLKQHFMLLYTINHYLFGINNKIKDDASGKMVSVNTGKEFIKTFKQEVLSILDNNNKLCSDKDRKSYDNICRFCGRGADLVITKDIVPLATGLFQKNLGQVHCCNYCYLSFLFAFITMINVRSSENSKGMYMFYHFSNERYMIEYARQQFIEMKSNMSSSLQVIIGPQYEVLVDDLFNRLKRLHKKCSSTNKNNINVTAYFLLNDNRGATFKYVNIPDGMCNFLIVLDNTENVWDKIKINLHTSLDYKNFINGSFNCTYSNGIPKNGFENEEILKLYLREVGKVDDKLISAAETIAKGLLKYYRNSSSEWVQGYEKKMNVEKSYIFINGLLDINEEYFKLYGENIFSVSDVKEVVGDSHAMTFRLIKYFIYNNMTEKEKHLYVLINKAKVNMEED